MVPLLEICAALANLAPIIAISNSEEQGNALPRHHGVDGKRIQETMSITAPAMPHDIKTNLSIIRDAMGGLGSVLQKEYDREILQHGEDAFLDIKLARLTDAIIGAWTDWADDHKRPALKRFRVIVEDFYVTPLAKLIVSLKSGQSLPTTSYPIVTFSDTQTLGIHTISPDVMDRMANIPVGLISMPAAYADFPVLWVALAHEICGHDVVRAFDQSSDGDSKLFLELMASFDRISPTITPGWEEVWKAWLEEAIADVYGLIVMGPMFAVGMAAWLSTTNAASNALPTNKLGELTNFIWLNDGSISEHPPNLIRLHILAGALKWLITDESTRDSYIATIDELIEGASGGQTHVAVIEGSAGEIAFRYPIEPLTADARIIGRHLASVRLPMLGCRCIAELMPWDNTKEENAREIARLFVTDAASWTPSDLSSFSSVYMMAGAFMAMTYDPRKLTVINERLMGALDKRYEFLLSEKGL